MAAPLKGATSHSEAIAAVLQGMDYLSCHCLGHGTKSLRFQDKLEEGHPIMLAALEIIMPGDAAMAASRLDSIKRSCKADALQGPDLAAIDQQFSEAQARLDSCPSALRTLKSGDPVVAGTICQWPLLKGIFGSQV